MSGEPRVVVVGAGIIGLLAAWACAARGALVSVLERGQIPNPDATSFDEHRIVRALHVHDPVATRRAVRARARWQQIEHRLGTSLFVRTGALTALRPGDVEPATAALAAAGARRTLLSAADAGSRWPQLRIGGQWAMLEPDAGIVLAERALRSLAGRLARHPRVQLHPWHEVTAIDPDAGEVRTRNGQSHAGSILLTTGVHGLDLVPAGAAAGIRLYRQSVLYCRIPAERHRQFGGTPAVTLLSPADGTWLVPPVAGTRLKLSAATACRRVDAVTDRVTPPRWRAGLVDAFTGQLAGISADWVTGARDCYYATAGDGGALATVLGPRAVAHLACGGTSFKFAPLIAAELADRLLVDRAVEPTDEGVAGE